jgi:hypothetical protein
MRRGGGIKPRISRNLATSKGDMKLKGNHGSMSHGGIKQEQYCPLLLQRRNEARETTLLRNETRTTQISLKLKLLKLEWV